MVASNFKTVFITGASSGFGEACAKTFASNGYKIILCARRKDKLLNLSQLLQESCFVPVHVLAFDVRNEHEVFDAISSLPEEFKNIDVLINNAGLALGRDYFDEANLEDWNIMIDTNIKGAMYVAQAVVKLMEKKQDPICNGHVINMGSVAAKNTYEKGNLYCATKAALDAMSKGMRIDLLRKKIKVTVIHPGAALTEFSFVRFNGNVHEAEKVYQGYEPLTANNVAEIIYYCSALPPHVCINDLTVTPTQQADGIYFFKEV